MFIGVARGPAGPAMAEPRFSWLYTNPMEQYSLAGPVVYYQLVWPDHFSARCDAPDVAAKNPQCYSNFLAC